MGNWPELAQVQLTALERHPLRAKLSLLVATAHHQLGNRETADRFLQQAQAWGCPRQAMARALLAGAYNSLARAHALRGRFEFASDEVAASLSIGFPGSEHQSMVRARLDEQARQLDLSFDSPSASAIALATRRSPPESTDTSFEALDRLIAALDAGLIPLSGPDNEASMLRRAGDCLARVIGQADPVDLVLDHAQTTSGSVTLVHVRGDYIPDKVVREGKYYELEFLQALAHFHRPDGLIVDIGANVGNHTLYFAAVLGARVAAFEPQPHNVTCLELNVRLNGVCAKTTVHRCALGSASGQAVLSMAIENNFGSFSAAPEANPNSRPGSTTRGFTVPVLPLDEVLQSHHADEPVSLLKIDVEGMEIEVLRGALRTIEQWQPLVACECFDRSEFSRVEAFLSPRGYSPVAVLNVTPTFLFICQDSPFHQARLAQYLRKEALHAAGSKKGFLRT